MWGYTTLPPLGRQLLPYSPVLLTMLVNAYILPTSERIANMLEQFQQLMMGTDVGSSSGNYLESVNRWENIFEKTLDV